MKAVRNVAAVCGIAVGLALAQVSAHPFQEQKRHHDWGAKGQQVMLMACVQKGQKDDTFVLTNVADVPVHPATMGRVVYWLDTVTDVKKHVGRQVRIASRIDEVRQGEMELRSGADDGSGWYVEIEGPGRNVLTTPGNAAVVADGRAEAEIRTTLVRLKVEEVTRVAEGCVK
jgi:hypothetical protein